LNDHRQAAPGYLTASIYDQTGFHFSLSADGAGEAFFFPGRFIFFRVWELFLYDFNVLLFSAVGKKSVVSDPVISRGELGENKLPQGRVSVAEPDIQGTHQAGKMPVIPVKPAPQWSRL
jgi:hypothetical protein